MFDRWVSKKEAAKIMGVSQKTIYNHRFEFGARLRGQKYEYHLKTLMDKAFDKEFLRELKNKKLVEANQRL